MCGITGFLNLGKEPVNPNVIKDMCDAVRHRGPDDAGYALFSSLRQKGKEQNYCLELTDNEFKDKNSNLAPIESDFAQAEIRDGGTWFLAMGHRRLAVIDLTQRAHEPISDKGRTVWLVYNGEIYNFMDLRKELEGLGYRFFSDSDAEVIIYAYKEWGIECVKRFNGMFAFALWDNQREKFFLARDRFGVIPVYYCFAGNSFVFGSEIKSILASKIIRAEIDPFALNEYFTFQNIFSDRTLFGDIKLLQAGTYIEIGREKAGSGPRPVKYWDYDFSYSDFRLSEEDAAEQLLYLFRQAVTRQLVSDVPVGSYLSGGMDSGSITAVAGKHFGRIYTFCTGFDLSSASGLELGFDERKYAEMLSNYFKTEHYENVIHAGDMEAVLPQLIWHIEDLRVGQSYPDYYASRLAGKFVKVVLSGGGGDELFGGYPWRYYRVLNPADYNGFLGKYYDYWQRLVQDTEKKDFFTGGTFSGLKDHSTFDVFRGVFSEKRSAKPVTNEDFINESMYFEIKTFLHGLFVITNKISMAHSLETRVPFLDNDLVDFACKIPPRMKLKNLDKSVKMDENEPGKMKKYYQKTNDGKVILRKAMRELIPQEILEREKQGFSAPDASWFRGESIEYVKQTLLDKKARIYDHLNPVFIKQKIGEHTSGKKNNRLLIWSLLSFEWWLRKFL